MNIEELRTAIKRSIRIAEQEYVYYSLPDIEKYRREAVSTLPFSIRLLLEAALRQYDGKQITTEHISSLIHWQSSQWENKEISFKPARVIFQDFTGIPALVDLAAMRGALQRVGGDPRRINPQIPVDLVIDHSVIIEEAGNKDSFGHNLNIEYERNQERYQFVRWAQQAFDNFKVIPPASGIVHQVNLEALATSVRVQAVGQELEIFPDSLVGTDSHTPMINSLGIIGWGVGGIEAEAAMLGQVLSLVLPQVIGIKLIGQLPEGATATDLALTLTNRLRKKGVVGKVIEFFGSGLKHISLADRATLANMAPEYGATMAFFPTDELTIRYLNLTGRDEYAALAKVYLKQQGLFRDEQASDPEYTDVVELDLSTIEPVLAGPKRPQDSVTIAALKESFNKTLRHPLEEQGYGLALSDLYKEVSLPNKQDKLSTGSIVLAAITSCTNTSNPYVMLAAGLLAKKAVEKGLRKPAYVKSSLTPGSKVVTQYLRDAGLLEALETLGFYIDGYGCAVCCGNSGSLLAEVEQAIKEENLVVASVLSGNRNFEGRIHPLVKANYLASPPLVIAYALAGTVHIDLHTEPIGKGINNQPVYLKDIWPTQKEVEEILSLTINPHLFSQQYKQLFENERWSQIAASEELVYTWDPRSTYIQEPPYFQERVKKQANPLSRLTDLKVLLMLGDSITTDHISPAGQIGLQTSAGQFLSGQGVTPSEFNSYGARRGNHQVMMRGTFANVRIRNRLADGIEGGYTKHLPSGKIMTVYDAAMEYQVQNQPLLIIAGKEYGTGSSRDWAAKGTALLGVQAVLAESFERIHRSNLVGMGVLPLQFISGKKASTYHLDGTESYTIKGLGEKIRPGQEAIISVTKGNGSSFQFPVIVRLDSMVEVDYYCAGGILHTVFEQYLES